MVACRRAVQAKAEARSSRDITFEVGASVQLLFGSSARVVNAALPAGNLRGCRHFGATLLFEEL